MENEIIERILLLQSRGERHFPAGIFPAFRENNYWFYRRPDTNIFYTATIVFTLNKIKKNLSEKSQKIVAEIIEKSIKNYPKFQNKDGLSTYNFYETNPSKHFPNGLIFNKLKHFQLPDDIDDTALIYLTSLHKKEEIIWLKEKLKQHSSQPPNGIIKKAKNTFLPYQNLKIYSTWFGKNMPIEFDVCALCNLLYLIFENKLSLNEYDVDTLSFLQSIILKNEFLISPFRASQNYATTPLIMYHYARLMTEFDIPSLEICREKLIATASKLLDEEQGMMNKVLLETTLMKLNKKAVSQTFDVPLAIADSSFRFFIAGLLSAYENPLIHFFASMKFSQIQWKCEAHNLTLILENLSLRKSLNS